MLLDLIICPSTTPGSRVCLLSVNPLGKITPLVAAANTRYHLGMGAILGHGALRLVHNLTSVNGECDRDTFLMEKGRWNHGRACTGQDKFQTWAFPPGFGVGKLPLADDVSMRSSARMGDPLRQLQPPPPTTPCYAAVERGQEVAASVETAFWSAEARKFRISLSARSELLRRCSDRRRLLVARFCGLFTVDCERHSTVNSLLQAWASPGCRPC